MKCIPQEETRRIQSIPYSQQNELFMWIWIDIWSRDHITQIDFLWKEDFSNINKAFLWNFSLTVGRLLTLWKRRASTFLLQLTFRKMPDNRVERRKHFHQLNMPHSAPKRWVLLICLNCIYILIICLRYPRILNLVIYDKHFKMLTVLMDILFDK